jgi:hypothetical protein
MIFHEISYKLFMTHVWPTNWWAEWQIGDGIGTTPTRSAINMLAKPDFMLEWSSAMLIQYYLNYIVITWFQWSIALDWLIGGVLYINPWQVFNNSYPMYCDLRNGGRWPDIDRIIYRSIGRIIITDILAGNNTLHPILHCLDGCNMIHVPLSSCSLFNLVIIASLHRAAYDITTSIHICTGLFINQ